MPSGIHLWSQTPANNATADSSINWAEGQAPSSVNDSARGMMARIADYLKDWAGLTTTGSSTAYAVTSNRAFASAAVMDGQIIVIRPHTTSGAAPTLAVDGLTARQIRSATGVNVPTGALVSGTPYALIYLNASTEFILLGGIGAITGLDIDGGTALTAPDTADEAVVYDASAIANRKITLGNLLKVIDTLTAKTAMAAADEVAIYDVAGTAAKKATMSQLLTAIDALTVKSAPASGDEVAIYDVSGTASKKATLAQIASALPAMTTQYLTSGTSATYTTPANCRAIKVKMIGGGGGGGATTTNTGSTGGTTTFNSVNANGGVGGQPNFGGAGGGQGGAGGSGGTGSATLRLPGSAGSAFQNGADSVVPGSTGAPGIFGLGAGQGTTGGGGAGGGNTGAGGAGGGGSNTGAGGGAGEYVELVIANPSATYTYTVGGGGNGGTAGFQVGGNGGSGLIIVEEFY